MVQHEISTKCQYQKYYKYVLPTTYKNEIIWQQFRSVELLAVDYIITKSTILFFILKGTTIEKVVN